MKNVIICMFFVLGVAFIVLFTNQQYGYIKMTPIVTNSGDSQGGRVRAKRSVANVVDIVEREFCRNINGMNSAGETYQIELKGYFRWLMEVDLHKTSFTNWQVHPDDRQLEAKIQEAARRNGYEFEIWEGEAIFKRWYEFDDHNTPWARIPVTTRILFDRKNRKMEFAGVKFSPEEHDAWPWQASRPKISSPSSWMELADTCECPSNQNHYPSQPTVTSKPSSPIETVSPYTAPFIASKRSKVFHKASCGNGKKIIENNRVGYRSFAVASGTGKRPAKCCNPSE